MKNFSRITGIVVVVIMAVGVVGCATAGKPMITQISEGHYRIVLEGGPVTPPSTLTKEWNKTATQQCTNFEVINQQYVPGFTQMVTGEIKCKK